MEATVQVLLLAELTIGGRVSGELDWAAGGSGSPASQRVVECQLLGHLTRRPAGSHDCRQAWL